MSTISAGSFLAERHTKKRRISSVVDVGGPIEDTDTAILKLMYVGFDLGKYNKDINEEQKILYIMEDTVNIDDDDLDRNYDHYDEDNDDDDDGDSYVVINIWVATPRIYFCLKGDIKMCRYLFVNGASCRGHRRNIP